MNDRKVIHDPLHGSIKIDGIFLEILDRHEFQRLHSIKQLGLANVVFPGANHTRMEHSLGVYHLAGKMSEALDMNKEETEAVRAAAMLHDLCHPPFSHTTEEILENEMGMDHMELARKIIFGEIPTCLERDNDLFGGAEPISVMLEDNGISPDFVCNLIAFHESKKDGLDMFTVGEKQSFFSSKDYAHQIIHGPVDADQMDYLMRDAHYTGVSHGAIDLDRIMSQMMIFNNKLVLEKGGIAATEGLMVARALMYSSVYYHKTVRIVEMMLTKSIEMSGLDLSEMYLMDDTDMTAALIEAGGKASELMRSVMKRRLYKKAFALYTADTPEDTLSHLTEYSKYEERKKLEAEIADKAGVGFEDVVVDMASRSALLSHVKIGKTDVSILHDGKVKSVTKFSPLAKSLQSRSVYDWAVMVSAPPQYLEEVRKAAEKVLSL